MSVLPLLSSPSLKTMRLVWDSLGPHLCSVQLGAFLSFIKFKTGCIPREWLGWPGLTIVLSHIEIYSGSLYLIFNIYFLIFIYFLWTSRLSCVQGTAQIVSHVKVEKCKQIYWMLFYNFHIVFAEDYHRLCCWSYNTNHGLLHAFFLTQTAAKQPFFSRASHILCLNINLFLIDYALN